VGYLATEKPPIFGMIQRSGKTERAHRYILQERLEITGAWWTRPKMLESCLP
jgi:hypothetical protein